MPRDARDIHGSNWSVGAETMDRDYTVYKNWKQYLGPLGVKHARIQSGWAKTEKEEGIYDWAWLDEIVHDMIAQGVTPWLCICYGNSIYPEGGDTRLNGWPRSEETLAAWDRYVTALVKRYRSQVSEWEIWNEPGVHLMNDSKTDPRENATDYADFFIRTATVVRREQPAARILGLALPKMPLPYAECVLQRLKEKNALGLLDELTYHPYNVNPDASYDTVRRVREFTYDIEGGDPGSTYTVFAYRKDEANMLVLWRNNDRPGANPRVEHVTITLPPAMWMIAPVLVDLRTGKVYQGPVKTVPRVKMTLSDVPVYDSPIVLAHLGGLPFAPPDDPPCETATPSP